MIFNIDEIKKKIEQLNSDQYVLKAQIHAGWKRKGGGVKVVNSIKDLEIEAKKMFGIDLITHQTGPEGKVVKRLYLKKHQIY